MRTCYAIGGLALAIVANTASAGPDDPRAVVDRAIQAHGARRNLRAKAHAWKANGAMIMGGNKMAYTADYVFAVPGQMRFDLAMDNGGQKVELTAATDGKVAWEQMGTTLRDMPKEKQTEFIHTGYVMTLAHLTPLTDKAFTLTSLGESKVGDQTVNGIKVSHPERRDVSMFFDKKTGLLTKTSTRVMDEFQNKEVTQDAFFTGYQDKDGMKVFDKLTIQRDGKDFIVEEFSEQRVLDKFDRTKFTKPAAEK